MNEQQDKLSSLMDEFSGDEQSRRTLDEIEGDVNLQHRLRRYQMIGQVMRHELPRQIDTDFSTNVMAKIDATGSGPGKAEQLVSADQIKIELLTRQKVQASVVPATSSLNGGMRWKINGNAPALQQKLNAYLVNHTEYSNSIQGLIPQARVAGYDTQQ